MRGVAYGPHAQRTAPASPSSRKDEGADEHIGQERLDAFRDKEGNQVTTKTKPSKRSVLAWWFAAPDKDGTVRLPHGDGRPVVVGETLTVIGPIVPCERGLHASRRAIDAIQYAPGAVVCRVRCSGEIVEEGDKLACSERTVLWMADASRVLRLFACDIAKEALLAERKRGREPHADSWRAVEVARRWIEGKATDGEQIAARSAAGIVAGRAAWGAARSAAGIAANRRLEQHASRGRGRGDDRAARSGSSRGGGRP